MVWIKWYGLDEMVWFGCSGMDWMKVYGLDDVVWFG
jgi:hypothetical protein